MYNVRVLFESLILLNNFFLKNFEILLDETN